MFIIFPWVPLTEKKKSAQDMALNKLTFLLLKRKFKENVDRRRLRKCLGENGLYFHYEMEVEI